MYTQSTRRASSRKPRGDPAETLQSTQEEPGGRPYRNARMHPTGRTREYSTKRYTVIELCYVTQVYAT